MLPISNPRLVPFALHGLLSVALLLLGASASAQPLSDAPRMVEVDGQAMQVRTAGFEHLGAGQPVVVFESGAGTPLQNWDRVFTDVAAFAPVVAYDRVGIGGTAWDGEAPTPERVVARLHALLAELEAPPPYVLVGHSWGGALIHYFAGHYPDEVAGLVYVDAPDLTRSRADHLAMFTEAGAADPEAALQAFLEAGQAFVAEAPPGIRAEHDVIRDQAFQREPEERGLRPVPEVPTAVLLAGRYEPPSPQFELPFDFRAYFETDLRQRVREMGTSALEKRGGCSSSPPTPATTSTATTPTSSPKPCAALSSPTSAGSYGRRWRRAAVRRWARRTARSCGATRRSASTKGS